MSELRWRHPLEPHNVSMRQSPRRRSPQSPPRRKHSAKKHSAKKHSAKKHSVYSPNRKFKQSKFVSDEEQVLNRAFYKMLSEELHNPVTVYDTPDKILHIYERVMFFVSKYMSTESGSLFVQLGNLLQKIVGKYPPHDERHIMAQKLGDRMMAMKRIQTMRLESQENRVKAVFFGRKHRSRKSRSRKSRKSHKKSSRRH
jgi:hypothetical protein